MPHLVIEMSANIGSSADDLLLRLVGACASQPCFSAAVVMGRIQIHERYRVQGRGMSAFVSVTLRMRPGRTPALKRHLAEQLAGAAHGVVCEHHPGVPACITCEIQELNEDARALAYTGGP